MPVQERSITVVEFEQVLASRENADRLIELVDGEVCEKAPTEEHGLISGNIAFILGLYVRRTKLGRVGVEVRHRSPSDQLNSRLPDISFSTARRPLVKQGSVLRMPDLAVEIKSPGDSFAQMQQSAAFYLANGSHMVWLVFPERRQVEVHENGVDVVTLSETDMLAGGGVLPGFQTPVAEIFADPLEEEN